jgi:hypothetical protein
LVGRVGRVATPGLGERAGGGLTLLRVVYAARNERTLLLSERVVYTLRHQAKL